MLNNKVQRILPNSLSTQQINCDERQIISDKNHNSNQRPLSWNITNDSSSPSPKLMASSLSSETNRKYFNKSNIKN